MLGEKLHDAGVELGQRHAQAWARVELSGQVDLRQEIPDLGQSFGQAGSGVFVLYRYLQTLSMEKSTSNWSRCTHNEEKLHGSPGERDIFGMMLDHDIEYLTVVMDSPRKLVQP